MYITSTGRFREIALTCSWMKIPVASLGPGHHPTMQQTGSFEFPAIMAEVVQ